MFVPPEVTGRVDPKNNSASARKHARNPVPPASDLNARTAVGPLGVARARQVLIPQKAACRLHGIDHPVTPGNDLRKLAPTSTDLLRRASVRPVGRTGTGEMPIP